MPAPLLHTPRLTLRGHVMADLEQLCDLFETDRARYMGGQLPRKEAWRWLASEVGMWDLIGLGSWGIEDKNGSFLGQIGLLRPPHYPETEIGWTLLEHAEGKGYAAEAAGAVLLWAWEQGIETLVSYIDRDNSRSIALAERLGAVHDPDAALPPDEAPEETLVYRHRPDSDGSPEAYA
ncbi:GNAT family N-acetyltransferase [Salipiger abyssi]|uniref:GNAT family N-acetyltransferase n=1 Tax=Salipiger abyssi TaxID=1250539 RepID=UPI0009763584|nr:GNAT family N-acetyltransferase [Salipiger abyssi]